MSCISNNRAARKGDSMLIMKITTSKIHEMGAHANRNDPTIN